MIDHGATTVWELWQQKAGPSMNSQNHPALASLGAWLYQALGGINLDTDGAGYRRILIRPQIVRDLTSASATVETVRGKVSCAWTRSGRAITVDVTVPVNSEARLIIPKDREMTGAAVREGGRVIWEDGRFVPGVEGVKSAVSEKRHVAVLVYVPEGIIIDVGSGHYSFTLTAE
jgi:alpha-L-rhamnosidase